MGISTIFTNRSRAGVFCLILLVVLLGVSSVDASDKIRIGYSGVTVSNAMLWVTDEGKLFQKNDIDPQILYLQPPSGRQP